MHDNRTILQGDVLEKLKEIDDECIDCIITSPPYWGLRDYGVDGQLGLESDFRQYLEKMGIIMEELKRVLKKTGTCWVNLGDTYGYNEKSRYGIPERFYINCIDSGWIARNHIPWYKSNAMPSSVKDRFSNKWESVLFFAKEKKYYFNLDAVREKMVTETKPFNVRVRDSEKSRFLQKALDSEKAEHNSKGEKKDNSKIYGDDKDNRRRMRDGLDTYHNKLKQDSTLDATGKPNPTYKGFNERWAKQQVKEHSKTLEESGSPNSNARIQARIQAAWDKGFDHDHCLDNPNGKNPGDVFFINPKPFPESHFATFPVELPERILKCACPENGIVLDPFFGAGTVGLAAEKLNRQWMGIELNSDYIKIAQKRLKPYLNNKMDSFTS